MEPWDGPAAMGFTDGIKIGAVLDRNGCARPGTMSPATTWSFWPPRSVCLIFRRKKS